MDLHGDQEQFLPAEERTNETGAPVTFESSEPETTALPDRRKHCDQSWRPGDPGFRIN
jgi:hypothetical protein